MTYFKQNFRVTCYNTNSVTVYTRFKKKFLKANQATFVAKELRKAIMHRSRMQNKF